jgi:hypothetical protein
MSVVLGSLVRRFAMLLFILVAPSLSPNIESSLSTRPDPAAVDPGHVDAIAARTPRRSRPPLGARHAGTHRA